MKKIMLLLLLTISISISISIEAKLLNLQLEISFEGNHYSISQTNNQFIFKGPSYFKKIDLKTCNQKMIDDYFLTYRHLRKNNAPWSLAMKNARSIMLKENNFTYIIGPNTKLGYWLRETPERMISIITRSNISCKKH